VSQKPKSGQTQRRPKRRPVALVGNMVTLGVINLDEPAKPARQA